MGLRNASVRHPNVVVMAPALTETAQPHNFNLSQKPNARFSLSLKNFKTLKEVEPFTLKDVKPDVSEPVYPDEGMNGHSPSKTTYNINGLAKSVKNEFVPLDKCSPVEQPNIERNGENVGTKQGSNSLSSNYTLTHIGGFMMNSSCNSMGDSEDNMGLQQKSNQDLTMLTDAQSISPSKEKMSQGEVDQLFKNLGVVLPDEIPGSGELGQNVDEILQVINNIDENPGSDIPPLGSTPSDGESIFPMSSTDIAGSLTSFERELFNEVDMMNMCLDESLVNLNKETDIKDRLEEARNKQFQLKRKCDFLIRRLRKLQTRTLGKHVCDEVTGILEYTSNMFEAFNRSKGQNSDLSSSDVKCDIKGVSLTTLSLLMRQMEHSATQQANYLARNSNRQKYFGSGSSNCATTSNGMRLPGTIIPSFKPEVKKEIDRVTGELQAQLTMAQSEIDSDLTASSSGCDSCDEFTQYNNASVQPQHQIPINKRALWKYSLERGLLASRWTWLQARMADLEYRIRQTNELRRHLRTQKGAIRLQQAAKQQPTNGLLEEGGCSRTVGVVGGLRRRRLVSCEGLHNESKRAGRPTSIKCCCRGASAPCLICTGRHDPTSPAEPINLLPVNQRIALLDPSFHPQLSLSQDVSQSIHYSAVMKCTDWQSKAGRVKQSNSGRGLAGGSVGSGVVIGAGAAREAVSALETDSKRCRVLSSPALGRSTTPPPPITSVSSQPDLPTITTSLPPIAIRKKNPRGRRRKTTFEGFKTKPRKTSFIQEGESSRGAVVEMENSYNGGDTIKYLSPVPSPTPSKDQFRRKRENSYDIDNIVIPYCMAASTRPERLHYKEILTPKWRLVKEEAEDMHEVKNGGVRRPSHELEGEEDESDEAVIARHERCEQEERKKFLSYMKVIRGGRGQRRTDSRAESSGPNTPDPMSPMARESGNSMDSGEGGAGMGSSPSRAPSPPSIEPLSLAHSGGAPSTHTSLPPLNQIVTRKRTVSSGSNNQPKSPPLPSFYPEVAPYEPRVFPLADEEYQNMVQEQKAFQEYPVEDRIVYKNCEGQMESDDAGLVQPLTPCSQSTDSAESFPVEDPNDPEWTSINNKR